MTKAGIIFAAAAIVWGFLIHTAAGQTELQPGLWEEIETGNENNQPARVEKTTRCMTAEEAKQPTRAVVFDEALRKRCNVIDLVRTGDDLSFRLQCGADAFSVNMGANFTIHSPQQYSGTIKASLRLGTLRLSANKQIDAKRIGDCEKNE